MQPIHFLEDVPKEMGVALKVFMLCVSFWKPPFQVPGPTAELQVHIMDSKVIDYKGIRAQTRREMFKLTELS